MHHLARLSLLPLVAVAVAACDALTDDSDIGGLIASHFTSVLVDGPDVSAGVLVSDGAVNPDTFLANLREQMGTIESVDVLRIELRASNEERVEVSKWADVYQGEILVQLVPSSGGAPVQIGRVAAPEFGLDPLTATVTTRREVLDGVPDIAAGRFSVRLTAGTPRSASDSFKLPIRVELELIAF